VKPREYETIFVIRPDASETEMPQVLERLRNTLKQREAIMLEDKYWGKKRLAYEVNKHMKGHYYYFNYIAMPGTVEELERIMKLVEPVIKFQTVKLMDNVDVDERLAAIKKAEEEAQQKAEEEAKAKAEKEAEEEKAKEEAAAKAAEKAAAKAAEKAEAKPEEKPAEEAPADEKPAEEAPAEEEKAE